jgi:DNA polymerase III subunit beta
LIDASDGEVELTLVGAQLIVKYNTTTLMIRLVEGKYPNYAQFLPTQKGNRIVLHRETFLACLRRVALLANIKSKAVTIQLSKNKMEIFSNTPEFGDAKEEIPIEYNGKDFRVGFNSRYILEALTVIKDDEIEFEFIDESSPGIVRPHKDVDYTCIVMPMRV